MSTLKTDVLKDVAETVSINVVDLLGATNLRQDLADDGGSDLIGFIHSDLAAVTRTAAEKMGDTVSVLDFMTDAERADTLLATPLLDHTASFQAALDYIGGAPIRERSLLVNGGRRYRVGTITIKTGTEVHFEQHSIPDLANNAYTQDVASQLRVITGGVINMQQGCAIVGGTILRDGLTFPQTAAQVATWTGTGINVAFAGCTVRNTVVLGFNTPIANAASRCRFRDVLLDGLNGINISTSFDITYLDGVHVYPYSSLGTGDPNDLKRPGIGIYVHDVADWCKLSNCFTYGYGRGYQFENVNSVTAVSCSSDNVAGHVSSIGFYITGTDTAEVRLISPQSAASAIGIQISSSHTSAAANSVHITEPVIWSAPTRAILINSATGVYISGGKIRNTPFGISIANATASGSINGVTFANDVTTECIQHVTSGPNWGAHGNILESGGSGRMETLGKSINSIPSAATFIPDQYVDYMTVSGTAGITAISGVSSSRGRRIVMQFLDSLTITHGASLSLRGGVNASVAAGNIIEFAYSGNNSWQETARNF